MYDGLDLYCTMLLSAGITLLLTLAIILSGTHTPVEGVMQEKCRSTDNSVLKSYTYSIFTCSNGAMFNRSDLEKGE